MPGERTRHAALTQREPIFAPVTTFEAWRASGYPIDLSGVLSLAEAEIKAAMRVGHKECFDILETNHAKAIKTLHTYTVRQGKREWRRDRGDGQPGYFAPLYPDKLMSRAVESYVPVRPFDAFQDCPVGVDRTLVVAQEQAR